VRSRVELFNTLLFVRLVLLLLPDVNVEVVLFAVVMTVVPA